MKKLLLLISFAAASVYAAAPSYPTNYDLLTAQSITQLVYSVAGSITNTNGIAYDASPQYSSVEITNTGGGSGTIDFTNAQGARIRFQVSDAQAANTNLVFPDVLGSSPVASAVVVPTATTTVTTNTSVDGVKLYGVNTTNGVALTYDVNIVFTSTNGIEYPIYTNIVPMSNSWFVSSWTSASGPDNYHARHADHFFYRINDAGQALAHVGSNVISLFSSSTNVTSRWGTNAHAGRAVFYARGASNELMNWSVRGFGITYENGLPKNPTISGVTNYAISAYQQGFNWTTDLLTTNNVIDYGISTSYTNTVTEAGPSTSHPNSITNLVPGTVYHFQVRSYSQSSGLSTTNSDSTFTTLPNPLTPDLVWWKMTNGTGTTISPNVGVAGTGGFSWLTGKSGSGYSIGMNGTSSNHVHSASAMDPLGSDILTVTAWVFLNATNGSQVLFETSTAPPTTPGAWYSIIVNGNLYIGVGNTNYSQGHIQAPQTNAWTHLACVFNAGAGTRKLYINGVLKTLSNDGTGNPWPIAFNSQTIYMGARHDVTYFLNGRIDDFRIYSGELDVTQINTVMNDPQ